MARKYVTGRFITKGSVISCQVVEGYGYLMMSGSVVIVNLPLMFQLAPDVTAFTYSGGLVVMQGDTYIVGSGSSPQQLDLPKAKIGDIIRFTLALDSATGIAANVPVRPIIGPGTFTFY